MGELTVEAGSPFAVALAAARAAGERRDAERMDEHYRRAARLARGESAELGTAVAAEHISRLRQLEDSTTALARCEDYLAGDGENVRLRLLRVETDLVRGDYSRIDAELDAIGRIVSGRPGSLVDNALRSRLEGLAAARQGRFSRALECLRQAREVYAALGDRNAVTVVEEDLRAVTARRDPAVPNLPGSGRGTTAAARLARCEELRLVGHYEQALDELTPALQGPLDPAVRFFFLEAKVRLLRLLRAEAEADALMPALYQAAGTSAQPQDNHTAAGRLDRPGGAEPGALPARDRTLQQVRRLVRDGALEEAERLLLAQRAPVEPDDRHAAEWHLAAGELSMAIADRDRSSAVAAQAAGHLIESVRHAAADSLVAIRIVALRLLGHAHAVLDEMDEAVTAWAQAHRLEELVAALQPSDHVRIRMLRGAADEFDERIRVAARAIELGEPLAAATVVVAMEAARGAAILPRILPDQEPLVRQLPGPSDIAGARRWVRRAVRGLPRSQIVWMLHAAPRHVHHAFIGRRTLRQVTVPCSRDQLIDSIDALTGCWERDELLEAALRAPQPGSRPVFDLRLADIAAQLGIGELPELAGDVERIAVVAGGELSEIPFALLPCPGGDGTLIGRRYALSDLPCLSVRQPLRRRSRGQRATGRLLLQPDTSLTAAAEVPGRQVLTGAEATPAALRAELARGRYRQVRIDSHGHFGNDSAHAAIQLAPPDTTGRLSPDELQSMDLGATGTLVLGACETGMATRIGRDERTGFVRAGLLSGASAVLAARWNALDLVAARVLDTFEQNLRCYPRDVALFLAQRAEDTRDHASDDLSEYSVMEAHPVRWALWTLYGDAGHQTRCGPVRRLRSRLPRPARRTPGGQR